MVTKYLVNIMNYKSGSLLFIITLFFIIILATFFIKFSHHGVRYNNKKYFKQNIPRTKNMHYFDRDILQANQHSWHSNYKSKKYMRNLGHFRPRHPHHAL